MKTLTKLLLTNWHYFSHEVIDLGQINFLTGENGSGKTTIIDALQLIMLGDTAGHFFNKSASDKSSRTLAGYIRCEIGDKDDGSSLYLRSGRFSSYIACEMYDDENDQYFTVGVVFDNFEDGGHDNKYFYFDGPIPENEFIDDKTPMSQKELNLYLINNYSDVRMFPSNLDYREFIKGKFGNLSDNFFALFKKAIPFSPISNIEQFITEYVCDVENTINIDEMQENFRNYKKLEIETEELNKRVNTLKNICDKYNDYTTKNNEIAIKRYVVARADLQLASSEERNINNRVADLKADIDDSNKLLEKIIYSINEFTKKKDELNEQRFQSDVYKRRAIFDERYESLNKQIEEISGSLGTIEENLIRYADTWCQGISDAFIDLGDNFINSEEGRHASEVSGLLKQLKKEVENENINGNLLELVYDKLVNLQTEIKRRQFSILNSDVEIKNQIVTLQKEIEDLNNGKKAYDYRLIDFRDAIHTGLKQRYNKEVEVNFLSDLIDIKNEDWRVAIETYLNTQRFYLIVEPEYVETAIEIYDRIKNTLPSMDYGIVDTEKVILNSKDALEGSVADEVISTNKAAKAYVDMLLGALMKCEHISKLRNYPRSLTKDCMLYQNYVARHLKEIRDGFFIGSKSSISQKEVKEKEIRALNNDLQNVTREVSSLGKLSSLDIINANEVKNIVNILNNSTNLESLKKERKETKEMIDSLSDNYLETIEKSLAQVVKQIDELDVQKSNVQQDITKANIAIERLLKEDLPNAKNKMNDLSNKINESYSKDWIVSKGEPAFLEILSNNKEPLSIYNTYKIEIDNQINNLNYAWRYITDLRTKYNTIYDLNYDSHNLENTDYDNEYHELGEVKLAEYLVKIKEAKNNAMKEFRNDFLSKLKSNFDTVISQIDSLNKALEYATFGVDSYKFSVEPRQEYKEYYQMINDDLLLTGTDIDGEEFSKKYSTQIENLFRQITFTDSNDARSELEKNVLKYTDYRSYLKFDLIVTNSNGYQQRLSKTLSSKSGGETQTPFYISVLASFAQTYRLYMKNEKNNPIRLIVFDEAFSKMDATRIEESIKLLRSFGLQALVSAPSDKAQILSKIVDKTICVVRDNTQATTRQFYKK